MKTLKEYLKNDGIPMNNVCICTSIAEGGEESDRAYLYYGSTENVPDELKEMPVVFVDPNRFIDRVVFGILVSDDMKSEIIENRAIHRTNHKPQ